MTGKPNLQERYAPVGGLDNVLAAYRVGEISLSDVSRKVGVSRTSVENNLKSVFGVDVFEEVIAERRNRINQERRANLIGIGKKVNMLYEKAASYLADGKLATFKTIVRLASPVTGEPERVWFDSRGVCQIKGAKGIVKIRYAEPKESSAEYKIDRYRFNVTGGTMKEADAIIFCLKARGQRSYYVFPSGELVKIRSLNLKFDKHEKKSKYAAFLIKVEPQK